MVEFIANDINEFTNAVVAITRHFHDAKPWWRGQADKEWNLRPSLYWRELGQKETNMTVRFRTMARARHVNCPQNQDVFLWLFLMQHYRLPTRLLDWSESPLVALFFAVEDKAQDCSDAAIWALEPTELNSQQAGKKTIYTAGNSNIRQVFVEAFIRNPNNPDRRIISILTEQTDLRHMLQQSAFTIHGKDDPINKLDDSAKYIAKIVIPSQYKVAFRQVLALYGISRAVLFPDLENLAQEITALEFNDLAQPGGAVDQGHSGPIAE